MPDGITFFNKYIRGRSEEIYDYTASIGEKGDLKRLSGIDVAINSIRNLLLTPLGQYPFDPNYGSRLYEKVFELSDRITQRDIEFEVKERIRQFEDRVTVTKVESIFFENKKGIKVNVFIERNGVEGVVSLDLSDSNEQQIGLEDSLTNEIINNGDS